MGNPRIVSLGSAVPPYTVDQEIAKGWAKQFFSGSFSDIERLAALFTRTGIERRQFCVPPEWFTSEKDFESKNETYIEEATKLGELAIEDCLQGTGVSLDEIDYLIFVSTTGMATPSIDARLIGRLGLSPHTRRTPIWGLGCAGGAAGISHAFHHAVGHPGACVLLVAVELCGLTFNFKDFSKSNLVATALFGDGAAAVLITAGGAGKPGIEILDTQSTTWPDSLDVMGWNFMNEGMQVVFSRAIPGVVRQRARENIEAFLGENRLGLEDIEHFIIHPGGTKVIKAYEQALSLQNGKMDISREVLRDHGNVSSVTVLYVLEKYLRKVKIEAGSLGLLSALGPGFSAENILLRF